MAQPFLKRLRPSAASPLKPAADAEILDTTEMDAEEAFRAALEIVERKRPGLTAKAGTTS